ncbi:MAG: hydrogenase expression/formation protein HypE [Lentisphaerales bacterium]|nr:MAG: hydrogenase expression/formation protein HypE [Lentisphaerales bacterium]
MKQNDVVLMGHGGGGALTNTLIRNLIVRELGNPVLNRLDDGACLEIEERDLVFTTDSYVIDPIFFPGGDIGHLSVCGTVNDLAMQGAEPRYLSRGLIIQAGLLMSDLERIIASIRDVARDVGVQVVTGDTKVIENTGARGGIYINTSGIGVRKPGVDVSVANARDGDVVIVTGTIGDHGIAILNEREGLGMKSALVSDAAPLWPMIDKLLDDVPSIHCLRDPTRGGVAAATCDIAESSGCTIRIKETSLPVKDEVHGACNLLGLDPLNVANEGKAVVVCAPEDKDQTLRILRAHPLGERASVIGSVVSGAKGRVVMTTRAGGERIVDVPAGEDLPRIC